MSSNEKHDGINPLSKRYAASAVELLEQYRGQHVSEEIVRSIGRALALIDPQLLGLRDVAGLLMVSHQRVAQLRHAEHFPDTVGHTSSGPVWQKVDISEFIERRDQRTLF